MREDLAQALDELLEMLSESEHEIGSDLLIAIDLLWCIAESADYVERNSSEPHTQRLLSGTRRDADKHPSLADRLRKLCVCAKLRNGHARQPGRSRPDVPRGG